MTNDERRRRLGAVAGIVAPVVFVTTVAIEGWLRPGYDWRSMFVSELALGSRGIIQIGNFLVFGLLQFLFASGMAAEFPGGRASRSGPIVLRVIAIGMIASGLFVMDPLSTPIASLSWHCWLHGVGGRMILYGWPVSCFIFLPRFREEPKWMPLAPWTLAAGAVALPLAVVLHVLVIVVHLLDWGYRLGGWGGLIQRVHMTVTMGWQVAVAVRLSQSQPVSGTAGGAVAPTPPH